VGCVIEFRRGIGWQILIYKNVSVTRLPCLGQALRVSGTDFCFEDAASGSGEEKKTVTVSGAGPDPGKGQTRSTTTRPPPPNWFVALQVTRFVAFLSAGSRVARLYTFKPKIPIWVNFGGSCNGRCCYILWSFGIFYDHLVVCIEKNLSTLVGSFEQF
jgi:hypothetical protein